MSGTVDIQAVVTDAELLGVTAHLPGCDVEGVQFKLHCWALESCTMQTTAAYFISLGTLQELLSALSEFLVVERLPNQGPDQLQ